MAAISIALSATAMDAMALLYFSPGVATGFGQIVAFACLAAMFAGVVFVNGRVIFGKHVPIAAIATAALMLLFARLVMTSGLTDVPTLASIRLAFLPVVLFGAPMFVRMLIRVW